MKSNFNNPKRDERLTRYDFFDEFQNQAQKIFTGLRDNDYRAKVYQDENNLCICPGGRMGGVEKSILNVFWGAKPYDLKFNEKQQRRFQFLTEKGAALTFYRLPDGYVSIYLDPARVEGDDGESSGNTLILCRALPPYFLLKPWVQKMIWSIFMTMTENTDIDGHPTTLQKIGFWTMKSFLRRVTESAIEPRKVCVWGASILKWVFTVGLSGLLLLVIQQRWLTDKSSTETISAINNIHSTVGSIEQHTKQMETDNKQLRVELEAISNKMDSLYKPSTSQKPTMKR